MKAPSLSLADAPGDRAVPVPERPTHARYVVMAFLCSLAFLTYFDRVCIVRAQGDIQRDLGINDHQLSYVFAAFWLAYGLFEIPSGWLGDRFGARITLTRVVLAWSLFTALSGTATGFLSLLTYRFLFGVGEAGAFPNMARIQENWFSQRTRGRAGGWLWLMARWGGAFSPVIFGAMLKAMTSQRFRHVTGQLPVLWHLNELPGWRLGFIASGFLGLIWIGLFFPWFRDDPAKKRGVNAAELRIIRSGRAQGNPPPASHIFKPLFSSGSLWAISVMYLCASFAWSFYVSWMPRFLKDVHHLSFERSEVMTGMPLFFGGLGCLLGGALSDTFIRLTGRRRLGRALFPVIGYSTAAISMCGIPFVHTPHHAVVLMCVASFMADLGQGANWASIVDIGGVFAGSAFGFINMVGNAGNIFQPTIGTAIFRSYGWNTLFFVYACALVGAAIMWLFIDPRRQFYAEREPRAGFPLAGPSVQ